MLLGIDYPNQIRSSFFTETVKNVILFDTHDMIIADFCFSRILQVQTLCVCVCQPKNCRKILEFWLIVNLETKKVPLLALGLSRRPGSASQLRLAPPKRLTMEEEEEKDSDEAGAMFLSTVWCPFLEKKKRLWLNTRNIYIFQYFSKKTFWQCVETYCCEYQIKKSKIQNVFGLFLKIFPSRISFIILYSVTN